MTDCLKRGLVLSLATACFLLLPMPLRAQEAQEASAPAALTSLLLAACRQNQAEFVRYLTAENAAAFQKLPLDERKAVLGRISLLDDPGRGLISNDAQNHTVFRCETPGATAEFRFGDERVRENLAFVPVQTAGGPTIEFGMVREAGGWRLLSVGLLLFNIPQLSRQWFEQDLEARETAVVKTIHGLTQAVAQYKKIFGRLPESLVQLGPPAKDGVSPDAADLIADDLAAGGRGGYQYRYRIRPASGAVETAFEMWAAPVAYGIDGKRSFYLDAGGKLHGGDHQGGPAAGSDPEVPWP